MKNLLILLLSMYATVGIGQSSFHILGNLQIHSEGQLGFHSDLINDGMFDQNLGLVGFYNTERSLKVSGRRKPIFYDMITEVENDLILEVAVGVKNFKEFAGGRIVTPRNRIAITLDFEDDTPYAGATDAMYVDGYIKNTGNLAFTFPIGDDFRIRPMRISAGTNATISRGAYFFEDPNDPSAFIENFNTDSYQAPLDVVSPFEFWDLDGNVPTQVTLTWDAQSSISDLTLELSNLRVVGWSNQNEKWMDLGNEFVTGDFTTGTLTSKLLIPNDYEILTIGSTLKAGNEIAVYTGISPNGDGINDTLIIKGIETQPANELTIFNRWGVQVYRKKGYDNSWNGDSQGRTTPNKNKKLPAGTYFYTLTIEDQESQTGFIYLQQ